MLKVEGQGDQAAKVLAYAPTSPSNLPPSDITRIP